jgi:hypothetical protein
MNRLKEKYQKRRFRPADWMGLSILFYAVTGFIYYQLNEIKDRHWELFEIDPKPYGEPGDYFFSDEDQYILDLQADLSMPLTWFSIIFGLVSTIFLILFFVRRWELKELDKIYAYEKSRREYEEKQLNEHYSWSEPIKNHDA